MRVPIKEFKTVEEFKIVEETEYRPVSVQGYRIDTIEGNDFTRRRIKGTEVKIIFNYIINTTHVITLLCEC